MSPPDLRGRRRSHWAAPGLEAEGLDLRAADLPEADLRGAVLPGLKLTGARLRRGRLEGLVAPGLGARGADLEGSGLASAELSGADLEESILYGADLRGARLQGAQLQRVDLRRADLRGADLRGADLSGADLKEAALEGALLEGAVARGARLSGLKGEDERKTLLEAGGWVGLPPALERSLRAALWSWSALQGLGRWGRSGAQAVSDRSGDLAVAALRGALARLREGWASTQQRGRERVEAARQDAKERARLRKLRQEKLRAERALAREREAALVRAREAESRAGRERRAGSPARRPTPPPAPPTWTAQAVGPDLRALQRQRLEALAPAPPPPALAPPRGAGVAHPPIDLRGPEESWETLPQAAEVLEALPSPRPSPEIAPPPLTAAAFEAAPQAPSELEPIATGVEEGLPEEALDESPAPEAPPAAPTPPWWAPWRRPPAAPSPLHAAAEALHEPTTPAAPAAAPTPPWWAPWRRGPAPAPPIPAPEAELVGRDLRGLAWAGVDLRRARLADVDLRRADLSGADLSGADLTGADLRQARLLGARLVGANLTAARMADLDLVEVDLSGAMLDQTDLGGTRWEGSRVEGADITGAMGLSGRQREALIAAGARSTEIGLADLLGQLNSTHVRYGLGVLALGLVAWLGARFLGQGGADPALMEERAEELRAADPRAAAQAFIDLATTAPRIEDRVGWLVEAADLLYGLADVEAAEKACAQALEAAGVQPPLVAQVRLAQAAWQQRLEQHAASLSTLEPLFSLDGLAPDARARAILAWEQAARDLERPDRQPIEALFTSLSELPEVRADLHMALAELRSLRGDMEGALAELDLALALDLPEDQDLRLVEVRARVLDRQGDLAGARAAWEGLLREVDPASPTAHAARLALADLDLRQGAQASARERLQALCDPQTDPAVRARALLVLARLLGEGGDVAAAVQRYEQALAISEADLETQDEVRLGLAQLLLSQGDEAAARELLASLPPEAVDLVMGQAALGEARALLDDGQVESALAAWRKLAEEGLSAEVRREARAGQAEALARLGEMDAALKLWRELLAELPADDVEGRSRVELQMAEGYSQAGRLEEASAAWRALVQAEDPDLRTQASLGLAALSVQQGERARARALYQQVIDEASDPAWRIQALAELALLSEAEGRSEEAAQLWGAVLGLAPAGHSAAGEARLALLTNLAARGQVEEAIRRGREAAAAAGSPDQAAQVWLLLSEMLLRSGASAEARKGLEAAARLPGQGPASRAECLSAAARIALEGGDAAGARALVDEALTGAEGAELRLPLLALQVAATELQGDEEAAQAARADRDSLAARVPHLAGPILLESAGRARDRGDLEGARLQLERALALPLPEGEKVTLHLELGELLSAQGELEAARARYSEAAALAPEGSEGRILALLGQAQALQRGGQSEAALALLLGQQPEGELGLRWMEAEARLLTELEREEALRAWVRLEDAAGDDLGLRATALQGQAERMLAAERAEAALRLYDEALQPALDPIQSGWLQLGRAEALIQLGRHEEAEALLLSSQAFGDAEIALQSRLRRAQLKNQQERWEEGLELLGEPDTREMGPGWDTTITETRVSALVGLQRYPEAAAAWEGLIARWPADPEGEQPGRVGLAELALTQGELELAESRARDVEGADPGYAERAAAVIREVERRRARAASPP